MDAEPFKAPSTPAWALLLLGVVAGFVSGLLGVGGGIVIVPVLVGLARYRQHEAHGTSLAAIVVIAFSGGLTFALAGEVWWTVAAVLFAGGFVGSYAGAQYMHRASARTLKIIFGIVLLIAGARMLFG